MTLFGGWRVGIGTGWHRTDYTARCNQAKPHFLDLLEVALEEYSGGFPTSVVAYVVEFHELKIIQTGRDFSHVVASWHAGRISSLDEIKQLRSHLVQG